MQMPRELYEQMISHVVAAQPEEACGLIAGQGASAVAIYPVENRLHSPVAYEMEPVAQIQAMLALEAEGWDMLGIYHSHPHSPAQPSATDLAQAYYPDARYVIISLINSEQPVVRAFSLRDGAATETEFRVI